METVDFTNNILLDFNLRQLKAYCLEELHFQVFSWSHFLKNFNSDEASSILSHLVHRSRDR